MMRIAYGDLIGGISGDMFVAALLDAGLPLAKLKSELKKVSNLRFGLKISQKNVYSIRARRFEVVREKNEAARSWKQIRQLIQSSKLNSGIKEVGLEIFTRLAEAEARVHGIPVDRVHFHEVGATDSIIDIVSAAVAAHELKIDEFHFSPVPLGRGVIRSRHGPLPVPGPATLELLKKLPVEGIAVDAETVTPTGAAIVSTLGRSFGAQPSMTVEAVGYGAGEKDFAERPNLFRAVVGSRDRNSWREESMLVLETNIDDMNPQFYDLVMDRLFACGARDVFLSAIQMKKNRPAVLVSVIAEAKDRDKLAGIILEETTSIGVRYYPVSRIILNRSVTNVKTRYGNVAVKIVDLPKGGKRAIPEFDDLKKLAAAKKIALKSLYDEVMRNFTK